MSQASKITVFLAEDDAILRGLLQRVLAEDARLTVVGAAASGTDAVEFFRGNRADVLLLDLHMPGMTGLKVLECLAEVPDPPNVLVLSGDEGDETQLHTARLGAKGFLPKSQALDPLIDTIVNIAAGGWHFDPRVTARILAEYSARQKIAERDESRRPRVDASGQPSSEAFFRSVVESSSELVLLLEPNGTVRYASPSTTTILGYLPEELLGRNSTQLVRGTESTAWLELFDQAIEGGATREIVLLHKDGSLRICEVSVRPFGVGTRPVQAFTVSARDITERRHLEDQRRHLEEQLRQSQKMEAVGRLAGGVAHDFNNLLAVIGGYSSMLLGKTPEGDPSYSPLYEIYRASDRASQLVRQLLAFSRRSLVEPKIIDLRIVISEMHKMLYRLIGEDVTLESNLADETGCIVADPSQMEQVLFNLVVNARDAMPQGGRITITTRNVELDSDDIQWQLGLKSGSYVQMAVSDTGCGMSPETLSRIFEPFFTTKPTGEGTGLGLSTVYGIVKQSGGEIIVESEEGKGSTFTIFLPRTEQLPSHSHPDWDPATLPAGSETLLVVEDESMLRNFICQLLVSMGYRVLSASSAETAREILLTTTSTIHLLLTDVVMPGNSGKQLADEAVQIRPGIRVLFMSGYTDDAMVRHGILSGGQAFLQKPFAPATLARKLRVLLDSPVEDCSVSTTHP